MRSVRLQLVVTVAAMLIAAAVSIHRGAPPRMGFLEAAYREDLGELSRCLRWGILGGEGDARLPLLLSCRLNNASMLEAMIDVGVSVNERDSIERTPLHEAAVTYRPDIARRLLARGADVNARDESGETALHLAAWWGHDDIVELLLAHGAEVNATDNDGDTPLSEALSWGRSATADLLRRHGATDGQR